MKKSIALLLTLILGVALLAGCGGLSGKYTLVSMSYGDIPIDVTEAIDLLGWDDSDIPYLQFSGKKVRVIVGEDLGEGTYEIDGSTLRIISENGEVSVATIEGNTITLTESGISMVFEK